MNRLERLAEAVEAGMIEQPFIEVKGVVREVAPTHYRVSGLSALVKLGDRVRLEDGARATIGEVVRVDQAAATVKPFDARFPVGIGMPAALLGAMFLNPSPAWKGRVINALGAPVDGNGALPRGDRSVLIDAPPPAAMTRKRIKRPVRTGVRAIDLFTPLCDG